jgi:uncharacterized caspase-like protein
MRRILAKTIAVGAACALALVLAACSFEAPKISAPRYALVVGVTIYQHATDLTYPVNDATSMSNLLSSQGWSTTLTQDPTRIDIVNGIASVASGIDPEATFLFYFSGHGDLLSDNSTAIIAPTDANFITVNGNTVLDPSTVISASQLAAMLSALPTKNIIVILDSCYSGGFIPSGSATDASPQNYASMAAFSAFGAALGNFGSLLVANAEASGKKTPIVISAAGTNESSYDGTPAMAHGVFTYYLLQSATLGDKDGDGVVTTTEAYSYTAAAIKSKYDPIYAPAFLPHISGGTRDLALFIN